MTKDVLIPLRRTRGRDADRPGDLPPDSTEPPSAAFPKSLNVPASREERRFAMAVAAEIEVLPQTVTKALRSPLGEMAVKSHRIRGLLRPFVREWRARQAESMGRVAGDD